MIEVSAEQVSALLGYRECTVQLRAAMAALSGGETQQMLRQILPVGEGRLFGVMAGTLGPNGPFGSKLVSVRHDPEGGASHQGVVVLFDPVTGAPACQLEAGRLTAIRTAAASALATDILARPEARIHAIFGTGEQAWHHGLALTHVRPLSQIRVWGRSPDRAEALAARLSEATGLSCTAFVSAEEAAREADIISTVTSAAGPFLEGAWIAPGAHLNVVGSSYDGPREIDDALVARARFFGDSRPSVLAQGAELRHAIAAGRVSEAHFLAEIGEVILGRAPGRQDPGEITLYKSLGHIVQDISAGDLVCRKLRSQTT